MPYKNERILKDKKSRDALIPGGGSCMQLFKGDLLARLSDKAPNVHLHTLEKALPRHIKSTEVLHPQTVFEESRTCYQPHDAPVIIKLLVKNYEVNRC